MRVQTYDQEIMPGELLDNAKIAFVKGRFEEAVDLFGQVLDKVPGHLVAQQSRGTARLKLEDYEGAVEDFTAIIQVEGQNEKVFCSRGTAYLALKKYEEAMADFNRAIDINQFYPSAYFGRSELFVLAGEQEQARQDRDTATEIQRKMSQSHFESQGVMFQDPDA